jgi:hypothetical protein
MGLAPLPLHGICWRAPWLTYRFGPDGLESGRFAIGHTHVTFRDDRAGE